MLHFEVVSSFLDFEAIDVLCCGCRLSNLGHARQPPRKTLVTCSLKRNKLPHTCPSGRGTSTGARRALRRTRRPLVGSDTGRRSGTGHRFGYPFASVFVFALVPLALNATLAVAGVRTAVQKTRSFGARAKAEILLLDTRDFRHLWAHLGSFHRTEDKGSGTHRRIFGACNIPNEKPADAIDQGSVVLPILRVMTTKLHKYITSV